MEVLTSIKKQTRNYLLVALGTLGLACATNASAGYVVDYAVVGPGLGDYYIYEAGEESGEGGSVFYMELDKDFDSINNIDLLFLVEDIGDTFGVIVNEYAYNFTGIPWTDYHLELGYVDFGPCGDAERPNCNYDFLSVNSELSFAFQENDGFDSYTSMPDEYPNALWLDDGLVEPDDHFGLGVAFYLPESIPDQVPRFSCGEGGPSAVSVEDGSCYAIALRQTPSIAASVPAPAVIWLFGIGLVGLGFARRRKHS
jgi:hypothetical protein